MPPNVEILMDQLIVLKNGHGEVGVDLFGAQVRYYRDARGEDVLWRNDPALVAAKRAAGMAMREGIPICWPWFGPHPDNLKYPQHGFARLRRWKVAEQKPDQVVLVLETDGCDDSFPFRAQARLAISLAGDGSLVLVLATDCLDKGEGAPVFQVTPLFHPYFRVGDVRRVRLVPGLGGKRLPFSRIVGEVDRLIPDCGNVTIVDPVLQRSIVVEKLHASDMVVWNCGPNRPADMPEDQVKHYVCVEPGQVRVPRGAGSMIVMSIKTEYTT